VLTSGDADLRRDGKLRVPHITPARRLRGNTSQRHKRARPSMRRSRSSWLSSVTKTPSICGFQHSWGWSCLWLGWFRFLYSGNALSTCSKFGRPKADSPSYARIGRLQHRERVRMSQGTRLCIATNTGMQCSIEKWENLKAYCAPFVCASER
jgi:hypothetical protein